MSLINCPKCNHVVSNKAKKCINCGYRIPKQRTNKKTMLTLCTIVLSLFFLTFIVTIFTSKVSIKQYFTLISEKQFSCVIGNHNWKEATCVKPQHCLVCDSIIGTPLEHHWKEADCTHAKTCLFCKETEGKPLGHKVNIGNCNRCNDFVNKYDIQFTVIKESMSCLKNSYDSIEYYFKQVSLAYYATNELYYCVLAQKEALAIKEASRIAIETCDDISEFAELKKCFERIDTALYGNLDTELTLNNYISYTSNLSDKIMNSVTAYNNAVSEINNITRR